MFVIILYLVVTRLILFSGYIIGKTKWAQKIGLKGWFFEEYGYRKKAVWFFAIMVFFLIYPLAYVRLLVLVIFIYEIFLWIKVLQGNK